MVKLIIIYETELTLSGKIAYWIYLCKPECAAAVWNKVNFL